MPDQNLMMLYKQHRTAHDKYTYFLLAVAASAVAFAVQKTTGTKITWSLIPLGIAVLLWAGSFFFGCKNLHCSMASTFVNYSLLQLQKGIHPEQPDHPMLFQAAEQGIRDAFNKDIDKAEFYAIWQFRLLVSGAIFFLVWHILEMVLRTYAS